jgi:hypothetical protein
MSNTQFNGLPKIIKEKRGLLIDMYDELGYDMHAYMSGAKKLDWLGIFKTEEFQADKEAGATEEAGYYGIFCPQLKKFFVYCDESIV